ncbi:MAG: hypothetical protein C4334_07225 [Pyrinomonas sp.]
MEKADALKSANANNLFLKNSAHISFKICLRLVPALSPVFAAPFHLSLPLRLPCAESSSAIR